jgi:hypothetical protein
VIAVIRSRVVPAALLVAAVVVLASCAAGPNPDVSSAADAGFWLGLWHGMIAPITFVISLFTDEVNVYEVDNTGNWYDFGFVLGLSVSFGGSAGGSAGGRRRRSRGAGE